MRFRNFLHPPTEQQAFGSRLAAGGERDAAMRRLMSGLARQLQVPYRWPQTHRAELQSWENPEIPSGYTYLAQLVAHDCVFTSIPTGALSKLPGPVRNRRSTLLRLETIYGDGPDSSPHAYVPAGTSHLARNRLAVGGPSMHEAANGRYLFRDIARTAAPRAAPDVSDLTSAHVSDSRNDIHAAVSQITTLFLLLHNRIASRVEVVLAPDAFPSEEIRSYRIYFVTRALCERVFRAILRNDFLPRLLHPAVVSAYSGATAKFVDTQTLDAVPIEFASVLRFGHAMVRPTYVFNDFNRYGEDLIDMMLATSAARSWRMPLDDTWMAQWSHFFRIGDSRPNLSRRIGPEMSGGLFSAEVFGPVDATGNVGLGYRDLLSSAFARLWSVSALAALLRDQRPELARLSALLMDDEQRTTRLWNWLQGHRTANGLSEREARDLAGDPPLFFYVLFEAAHDRNGEQLGVLGSFILAETFYRALQDGENPTLDEICRVALGADDKIAPRIAQCAPDIATMAGLVSFVASALDVPEAAMPFV